MEKRGIRIEKPAQVQAPQPEFSQPKVETKLGFGFRFILVLSFILALASLAVVYFFVFQEQINAFLSSF